MKPEPVTVSTGPQHHGVSLNRTRRSLLRVMFAQRDQHHTDFASQWTALIRVTTSQIELLALPLWNQLFGQLVHPTEQN